MRFKALAAGLLFGASFVFSPALAADLTINADASEPSLR